MKQIKVSDLPQEEQDKIKNVVKKFLLDKYIRKAVEEKLKKS